MIDRQTAEQGISALAVAVASIMEDAHEGAVTPPQAFKAYLGIAEILRQSGADITALSAAIEVLARRAET